jgi:hypothetical protein
LTTYLFSLAVKCEGKIWSRHKWPPASGSLISGLWIRGSGSEKNIYGSIIKMTKAFISFMVDERQERQMTQNNVSDPDLHSFIPGSELRIRLIRYD